MLGQLISRQSGVRCVKTLVGLGVLRSGVEVECEALGRLGVTGLGVLETLVGQMRSVD